MSFLKDLVIKDSESFWPTVRSLTIFHLSKFRCLLSTCGNNLSDLVQWERPVCSKGKMNKYIFKIPTTVCLFCERQQQIFPSIGFGSSIKKTIQKRNVLNLASRDYE